jgi:hypothetical protein
LQRLYVTVKDVKVVSDIANPYSVRISLGVNKTNKALISALYDNNDNFNKSDLLDVRFCEIGLEDREKDAERIMDEVRTVFVEVEKTLEKVKEG